MKVAGFAAAFYVRRERAIGIRSGTVRIRFRLSFRGFVFQVQTLHIICSSFIEHIRHIYCPRYERPVRTFVTNRRTIINMSWDGEERSSVLDLSCPNDWKPSGKYIS